MKKSISRIILTVLSITLIVLSVGTPWLLDSHNVILDNFINRGNLLFFLSILAAITLFFIVRLHFALNDMERTINIVVFSETRSSISLSAYSIIISPFVAFILMSFKSAISNIYLMPSLFNSVLIIITMFNVLILVDIIKGILLIKPSFN